MDPKSLSLPSLQNLALNCSEGSPSEVKTCHSETKCTRGTYVPTNHIGCNPYIFYCCPTLPSSAARNHLGFSGFQRKTAARIPKSVGLWARPPCRQHGIASRAIEATLGFKTKKAHGQGNAKGSKTCYLRSLWATLPCWCSLLSPKQSAEL